MSNTETPSTVAPAGLKPDEARVLDALIESMSAQARAASYGGTVEASPAALAPGDDARAQRISAWLTLIGECPAETPPLDLAQRTLDRVADVRRQRWFAEQAQALAAPRVG